MLGFSRASSAVPTTCTKLSGGALSTADQSDRKHYTEKDETSLQKGCVGVVDMPVLESHLRMHSSDKSHGLCTVSRRMLDEIRSAVPHLNLPSDWWIIQRLVAKVWTPSAMAAGRGNQQK